MKRAGRVIAHVLLHGADEETYRQAFTVLTDITPVVQALPPDAALLDIGGALRYFDHSPAGLAELLRVRLLGRFAVECTVGIGPNRMLATLAAQTAQAAQAAQTPGPATAPGGVRMLDDDPAAVRAFLDPLPLVALPDIGPKTAAELARYGLCTVGALRQVPLATVQRLTGATPGRLLLERAHGRDPRAVQPGGPPASLTARRDFARDTLHSAETRAALLSCALELGARLRESGQASGRLELEVRYADRTTTTRSRTLREATDHTATLEAQLGQLGDSLGLQRARLRALSVRAQTLRPVESASVQLTFDTRTERGRAIDPVLDRATARFGPGALTRAALLPARMPTGLPLGRAA